MQWAGRQAGDRVGNPRGKAGCAVPCHDSQAQPFAVLCAPAPLQHRELLCCCDVLLLIGACTHKCGTWEAMAPRAAAVCRCSDVTSPPWQPNSLYVRPSASNSASRFTPTMGMAAAGHSAGSQLAQMICNLTDGAAVLLFFVGWCQWMFGFEGEPLQSWRRARHCTKSALRAINGAAAPSVSDAVTSGGWPPLVVVGSCVASHMTDNLP